MLARLMFVVYEYLDNAMTLEQLEDWLVPRLPVLFQIPDAPIARLAATIELGLAEIGDGVIDEEEFRNLLQSAVREEATLTFFYPTEMPMTESTSSNDAQYSSEFIGTAEPIRAAVWG